MITSPNDHRFASAARHWPAFPHAAETLCNDKAWTRFFADDAADITCKACEAALFRQHQVPEMRIVNMGRAIARELEPK